MLYLHIILLVLPDTFYLDESGSGFDRIRIGSGLFLEVGSDPDPVQIGPDPQNCPPRKK
jgi:hypothetical protein